MPKVSVIIASYNHEDYVGEAIQSVLDQSFQDFEIVIVDDASTDKSVERIKKFKDKRIKLIISELNKGQFATTNQAILASKGKYISILNSDDAYFPDKLERQVKFLEAHPMYAAVFSEAHLIDDKGNNFTDKTHFYFGIFKQPKRDRFEWLRYFFYHGNALCHGSSLVRRSSHNKIGLYNEILAQVADLDLWIRICLKQDVFVIKKELVKFRVRENQKNMSGVNLTNTNRFLWEYQLVLQHYLSIDTISTLLRIFPEVKNDFNKLKAPLISFYIAQLALKVNDSPSFVHQHFALDIFYDLLKSAARAQTLQKDYSFNISDFIKLTGKFNLFNLRPPQEGAIPDNQLDSQIYGLMEKIRQESSHDSKLGTYIDESSSIIKKLIEDSKNEKILIAELKADVENLKKEKAERVEELQKKNAQLLAETQETRSQIKYLTHSLNVIQSSKFFKLWRKYCAIRERLMRSTKDKTS